MRARASRRLATGDDLVGNWLSTTSGTHISCIKKEYLQNTYNCAWGTSSVDIQWKDGKFIWNSGRMNAEIDRDSLPHTLNWGKAFNEDFPHIDESDLGKFFYPKYTIVILFKI